MISCPHWEDCGAHGCCALGVYMHPTQKTCDYCLAHDKHIDRARKFAPQHKADPSKDAPEKIRGRPPQEILRRLELITKADGPCDFPNCEELRLSFQRDIKAAGGDLCGGCTLGAIKNKFARLLTIKIQEESCETSISSSSDSSASPDYIAPGLPLNSPSTSSSFSDTLDGEPTKSGPQKKPTSSGSATNASPGGP